MIKPATKDDLQQVMEVINDAKMLFKNEKSDQWQDYDGYPNEKTMLNDINNQELYIKIKNNQIVGCIVLTYKQEEAYKNIYDGNWSTNSKYMVMHRLSVRKENYHQGIAKELIKFAIDKVKKDNIDSIRVDTKIENVRMISLLKKFNFKIVGKIDLLRKDCIDKVRLALEYIK